MIDLLHGLIKVATEIATTVADAAITFVDNAKSLDAVLDNVKKEKEEKTDSEKTPESNEEKSIFPHFEVNNPMPETKEVSKIDVFEKLTDREDVYIGISSNDISSNNEEISKLKKYLINSLWPVPQLLLHYGITQKDINKVITPFQQEFMKINGYYVDAASLQLIYNFLQENYPLHELVKMGIYTEDGLLKINPVDVLYAKKEKSPAELAELELMKEESETFNDIIKNNVESDDNIKEVQKYTAILAASNPHLNSSDIAYVTKLLAGLEPETQQEIKKYIDSKKNQL